jgi:hypothetical protein
MVDYLFPGGVILLKFLFRLVVEEEFKGVNLAKALLVFPIDIGFLSLAFGTTTLTSSKDISSVKGVMTFAVSYFVALILITVFCKQSDKAFEADSNRLSVLFSTIGYTVALSIFLVAINI